MERKKALEACTAKGKANKGPSKKLLLQMYRNAYTTRQFELRCIELYRQGMIRGYLHPYLGEEAIAAGAIAALESDDYIVSTHRGHGHCIAKNGDLKKMVSEIMGRADGYCRGRGGSMHIFSLADGNLGANGIVGGGIPLAAGAAMASKVKKSGQVTLGFFSDGASNNGTFAESLNFAAIFDLPVVYILENNHYAVSTHISCSSRSCDLAQRAEGYCIPNASVDGNDAVAVYQAVKAAVDRARGGEGPTLVECKTFRHGGHHINDPGAYMDPGVLDDWKNNDPVAMLKKRIGEAAKTKAIEAEVDQALDEAIEFAKASPQPSVEEFLTELSEN